jgi:lipid-binding SYLF domain-containing protein
MKTYLFTLIFLMIFSNTTFAKSRNKEKERSEIQKATSKGLAELYKLNPNAKKEISSAYGYAVFSTTGVNLLVVASSNGAGLARSKGKDIYMKMYSAGVGVGAGVKKFYAIFIFSTSKAYTNFVNSGYQVKGQGDAGAKDNKKGASVSSAISIAPGVRLYQITSKGISAQITIDGSKYWKDKDLN